METQQLLYWKTYERDTSPEGLGKKTIPVIKSKDKIEVTINNITRQYEEDFEDEFAGFSPDAIEKAKEVAIALIDRDQYCGINVIEAVLFQETS